jgi:hypothetical protein
MRIISVLLVFVFFILDSYVGGLIPDKKLLFLQLKQGLTNLEMKCTRIVIQIIAITCFCQAINIYLIDIIANSIMIKN